MTTSLTSGLREAVDLDPGALRARAARRPGRDLPPVDGRPDADDAVLRLQARDRDLHPERVDAVAGEEVLAAAHVARALADRDEIEDRADVAEERIVPLAGERLAATRQARRHTSLRATR